jgi:hypothetical protein
METAVLTIFIFIAVITVTAVVFGIWVFVTILRGIFRGAAYLAGIPPKPALPRGPQGVTCPFDNCHAVNPSIARFCRRCGRELPQPQRVSVRRAAVW